MGIFSYWQALAAQADVAQLVERSIRNRQVSGSIPLVGSTLKDRNQATCHPAVALRASPRSFLQAVFPGQRRPEIGTLRRVTKGL